MPSEPKNAADLSPAVVRDETTCPDCGHRWGWHGDDGPGCLARVSEDDFCGCKAQHPPESAVAEVLVRKSALDALAIAVKGCGYRPAMPDWNTGDMIVSGLLCGDPESRWLCRNCTAAIDAAITALLDGGTT